MRTQQNTTTRTVDELVTTITQSLKLGDVTLREIDMEDVSLSMEVMKVLGQASGRILRHYVPHPAMLSNMINDMMQAYQERVFYAEETGLLVICLEIMGDQHYLQVPSRHWRYKGCNGKCN